MTDRGTWDCEDALRRIRVYEVLLAHPPCSDCCEVFYRQPRPDGLISVSRPCAVLQRALDAVAPGLIVGRSSNGVFGERLELLPEEP